MLKKRNKINYFFSVILISYLFDLKVLCDDNCNDCIILNKSCNNCNMNCRYYNEGNKCIFCGGIQNNYYKISLNSEGGNNIYNCEIINDKRNLYNHYGAYEVVDNCGSGYYSLGKICYQGIPDNKLKKLITILMIINMNVLIIILMKKKMVLNILIVIHLIENMI